MGCGGTLDVVGWVGVHLTVWGHTGRSVGGGGAPDSVGGEGSLDIVWGWGFTGCSVGGGHTIL